MSANESSVILTPFQAPPQDYYQNNCRELFEFTLHRYADILDDAICGHVQAFLDASDGAQRLFARILTRKGPNLRIDSLHYDEVDDLPAVAAELVQAGLIAHNPANGADRILTLLRKRELIEIFAWLDKRARKADMLETVLSRYRDAEILERIAQHIEWIAVAHPSTWNLMRLLYFGGQSQDWSTFVLRDLGFMTYEKVPLDERQFEDTSSLAQHLEYLELGSLARRIDEQPDLVPILCRLLATPSDDRSSERRRTRAVHGIGLWLERQQRLPEADAAYTTIATHPCRERRVRILTKLGDEAAAEEVLAAIRAGPLCEEEAQFAERFGKRRAGYQPPTTTIDISEPPVAVEAEALEMLTGGNGWGVHVESSLVRTLTGLLYWQAIFAPVAGAFTNPFQSAPNDLQATDFAAVRSDIIGTIEEATRTDDALARVLIDTARSKAGIANALVNWRLLEQVPIEAFLEALPGADIRKLTHFFIRNIRERRTGLPDLFVAYGRGNYEFVEVKGPNDQLQPGQRVWLRHLDELGIPARVLKLRLQA